MNTFVDAVINQEARTENGMKARKSSANAVVDLFYNIGSSRGKDIVPAFTAAFVENKELALRVAAWARDVRGGAGERGRRRGAGVREVLGAAHRGPVRRPRRVAAIVGEPLLRAEPERGQGGMRLGDLAAAPHIHPEAHEHAKRDGHRDGEGAPHGVGERIHERNAETRQGNHQDHDDRDRRDEADEGADLLLDDVGQRLAAAPHRRPQDHGVVDRAGQAASRDEPDEPGRVAELRREHRADQRACARDRREVMAEHDPLARRVVVRAVVLYVGWSLARIIQHPDLRRQESAVVPVRNGHDAKRRQQHIQSMHRV